MYPIILKPYVSETIWGGRKLIDEYHVVTDKKNAAEGWMLSCHPAGESTVVNGEFAGQTLTEVLKRDPALCGSNAERFEDFPILIKFIDARDDLSVQVHPTKEYCELTGRGQSKTECWYIIDCDEDAHLLLGFNESISKEQFEEAIKTNTLTDYTAKVKVKPGDFFFIESGTLHAICKGILLAEVQESSNTTYRIYDYGRLGNDGKPRELHVADALAVTKREKYTQPAFCKADGLYSVSRNELAECDLFKVWKDNISGVFEGEAGEDSFVSLLVLSGSGSLTSCGETIELEKGRSIFLPAGSGSFTVTGEAEILETRI